MSRPFVSGTTFAQCRRSFSTTFLTSPHRIASPCTSRAMTHASTTVTGRSVLTSSRCSEIKRRLLATFALQGRRQLALSPTLPITVRTLTSTATTTSSSSSSSSDGDGDESTQRYNNLSTPLLIAQTHFDLSHIPPSEHAQILHDFILIPEYLTPEEHDMMVQGATLKLKRALGKQVRYEDGHFDGVITRYRECSAGDWASAPSSTSSTESSSPATTTEGTGTAGRKERTTPREMMSSLKSEFFPSHWKWVAPHLLELEAGQGGIKPHVDHLDASGSVVAGLCLGSSAVMELIHQDDPQKWFRVLLPKRCFYFQRDSVRYSFKHGIPIDQEDHQFRGTVVPKEKRISVMLRNALEPSYHNNSRPNSM